MFKTFTFHRVAMIDDLQFFTFDKKMVRHVDQELFETVVNVQNESGKQCAQTDHDQVWTLSSFVDRQRTGHRIRVLVAFVRQQWQQKATKLSSSAQIDVSKVGRQVRVVVRNVAQVVVDVGFRLPDSQQGAHGQRYFGQQIDGVQQTPVAFDALLIDAVLQFTLIQHQVGLHRLCDGEFQIFGRTERCDHFSSIHRRLGVRVGQILRGRILFAAAFAFLFHRLARLVRTHEFARDQSHRPGRTIVTFGLCLFRLLDARLFDRLRPHGQARNQYASTLNRKFALQYVR